MIKLITKKVINESGTDLNLCLQCLKCTSGCPVAYEMDITPAQVIQALRLDRLDKVLSSRTIWLCASCETCSTRCPQGVDISAVMDAGRIIAQRLNYEPKEPDILSNTVSAMELC